MRDCFPERKNLIEYDAEAFKPPLFVSSNGLINKIVFLLRKFLDVQFGSIWRDLKKVLPNVSGKVLDIGCGAQPFRCLFNKKKVQYIGLDTIEAKQNFGYENMDTIYYSGNKFPIESGTVDFVLCTETLEHILEPNWFLSEIWRCLKVEGLLLITVPFAARWHFIPFDYWRYTPSSLLYVLSQNKFSDICVYARGNQITVTCYKVLGLMVPFLFSKKIMLIQIIDRLIGMLFLPLIFLFAFAANISLIYNGKTSEDCLGYTIIVEKSDE